MERPPPLPFQTPSLADCPELQEAIQDSDIDILKHVTDITSEPLTDAEGGFRLTFFFSENEFFENDKLEKDYVMDDDDMLLRTRATEIKWKAGKNVCVKLVKKKTRKGKVMKEEKTDSFFNFFTSMELPESAEDDEDSEWQRLPCLPCRAPLGRLALSPSLFLSPACSRRGPAHARDGGESHGRSGCLPPEVPLAT